MCSTARETLIGFGKMNDALRRSTVRPIQTKAGCKYEEKRTTLWSDPLFRPACSISKFMPEIIPAQLEHDKSRKNQNNRSCSGPEDRFTPRLNRYKNRLCGRICGSKRPSGLGNSCSGERFH